MKKYRLLVLAGVLLLGSTGCNKVAPTQEPDLPEVTQPQEQESLWKVSIKAGKGSDATKALEYDVDNNRILTSFKTTDFVYVYNKTKAALDEGCLNPDTDGTVTTISGTLKGAYDVGDELELRYGPYFPVSPGAFDYEEQTGSFETLRDFAVAQVTVTVVDEVNRTISAGEAHFTNPYSIFRFNFVDSETLNPVSIGELYMMTTNGKLVFLDEPGKTPRYYGPYYEVAEDFPRTSVFYPQSTDPVWLSICYEAPPSDGWDGFQFLILDHDNKIVYDGYKLTDGKITNGKFYSPTIQMTPLSRPTVANTETGDPVLPTYVDGAVMDWTDYYRYENPGDAITISGEGDQCLFRWTPMHTGYATVTLKENASFINTGGPLFEDFGTGKLTLVLDGNSRIVGASDQAAIKLAGFHHLVLKGFGALTMLVSSTVGTGGILATDASGNPRAESVSIYADDGYTLSINKVSDDGTYAEWVYTVSPGDSVGDVGGLPDFPSGGNPFNS